MTDPRPTPPERVPVEDDLIAQAREFADDARLLHWASLPTDLLTALADRLEATERERARLAEALREIRAVTYRFPGLGANKAFEIARDALADAVAPEAGVGEQ